MFVNLVEFPPIKKGKKEEFKKWFAWSNIVYEKFDGFISRRLLKPSKGEGNYVAIIEHESEETFRAMHLSGEQQKALPQRPYSSTRSHQWRTCGFSFISPIVGDIR